MVINMKDDNNFTVIESKKKNPMNRYKSIDWKREDSGNKVMSFNPVSMKALISMDQLEYLIENIRGNSDVNITFDSFLEDEKREKKKIAELEEMFKDDDNIIVFNKFKK